MIIEEYLKDGTLIRHYSDKNMMLLQKETGIKYSEAVDVVPCRYTYDETDEPTDETEKEAAEEDYLNSLERFGAEYDKEQAE